MPEGKLDPTDWALLQDVFHAAVELGEAARGDFVRERLAGRPELIDRAFALLREDMAEVPLLDAGVGVVAHNVLDSAEPVVERLGRYRVLRPLGQGGMGVVYLVERDDLGRQDALKVLRDAALSPARKARFLREQRTLSRLSHPGIAQLHDADVLPDGTPYFVMEYVDGLPLDEYVEEQRLSVRRRLELFRDVCQAVRFAHDRAIIHRDLKPSNILVASDGSAKLLDFGIAKDFDDDSEVAVTRTHQRMMTPAYAAPEQLAGEPVGVFTDVYALGAILYQLLSGRAPFDLGTLSPAQAERAVLEGATVAPSVAVRQVESGGPSDAERLAPSGWTDLDVLCSTAMHREVDRRYASVGALVRDIDRFLRGEPLEARPDSLAYRVGKFTQRHTRAIIGLAAALAVLTGTSFFYALRLADARDQALVEAERARRIQSFTENLFEGGDGVAGPADTLRVVALLDRGVDEARLLSRDPETQAQMFLTLGTMFSRLGAFDRADSLIRSAHGLRADAGVGDLAESAAALGELQVRRGDYEEGESILREAVARYHAEGRAAALPALTAVVALGQALEGQGAYDEAIDIMRGAVADLRRLAPGGPELSGALSAMSTTHFYAGDLDAADSLTLEAMDIDRALHGEGHPTLADGLINLAAAEVQRGRYVEAEPLFRDALQIFEQYHGRNHPETASALRMLGNDLLFQGRLDEAGPLLERALIIQEEALAPDHPRLANTLNDLAYVWLESGRSAEAIDNYRRIVDIYRTANGERHYFVAIGLSNLANALSEAGRLSEAEDVFEDVIARFVESRGDDHLDTGIARIKLGRVLVRQGRFDEAELPLVAGYELVSREAAPTVSWLRAARSDLATVYHETGRPDRALHYEREQAELDAREGEG